jgi:peptidoglycan hydrolase-like protein with peptidoglycan-binding domain
VPRWRIIAQQTNNNDPDRRLPPELWMRIVNLQPGDARTIVTLAHQYPEFVDAILTQAAGTAGNHAVAQATEMLAANPVTEAVAPQRGHAIAQDLSYDGFDYTSSVLTLEGGDIVADHLKFLGMYPHLRTKVLQGLGEAHPELFDDMLERLHAHDKGKGKEASEKKITEAEVEATGGGDVATAPKEEKKEATWITGAKRFNAAHAEHVDEFNRVTDNSCVGTDGVLDPALVSDWQVAHGVTPDGRVGAETVDAAKRAAGIGHPIPMPEGDLGLE